MVIGIAMLVMFYLLFNLIKAGEKLSDGLQQQKSGLQLMMALVVISYILAALLFFFYGSYHKKFGLFIRWLIYPITILLLELPNMLIVYVIHWKTYGIKEKEHTLS